MNTDIHPAINEFIRSLVSCDIILPGEAFIIALTNRKTHGQPNWGALVEVAATRAAHKIELRGNDGI